MSGVSVQRARLPAVDGQYRIEFIGCALAPAAGPQVAYWPAVCGSVGGVNDGVRVNAVVVIEIGDGAGVLNAHRLGTMAADGSEPGERRGMAVEHGYQTSIAGQGHTVGIIFHDAT
jgi:hypothetical protein